MGTSRETSTPDVVIFFYQSFLLRSFWDCWILGLGCSFSLITPVRRDFPLKSLSWSYGGWHSRAQDLVSHSPNRTLRTNASKPAHFPERNHTEGSCLQWNKFPVCLVEKSLILYKGWAEEMCFTYCTAAFCGVCVFILIFQFCENVGKENLDLGNLLALRYKYIDRELFAY